jgi:hypothetical protein
MHCTIASPARSSPPAPNVPPPLGWSPGAPGHITAETQPIDAATCRRMKCGKCRRRGLDYVPMHYGPRYRVQALCPDCGHGEAI